MFPAPFLSLPIMVRGSLYCGKKVHKNKFVNPSFLFLDACLCDQPAYYVEYDHSTGLLDDRGVCLFPGIFAICVGLCHCCQQTYSNKDAPPPVVQGSVYTKVAPNTISPTLLYRYII